MDIPVDVYDSPQEFVVIVPLGGVDKESVKLWLDGGELVMQGERKEPVVKKTLVKTSGTCFWGSFSARVKLPPSAAFDRIHSQLSPENILTVIVPKVIIPEQIMVKVQ